MTDQDPNSLPQPENGQNQPLADDFIPPDALPLCPQCLSPCNPLQYYCDNCDSNEAICPLAAYMPFIRIRFVCGGYGKMWRTIWYDKDASIMFKWAALFMVILFAPVMLVLGLPFLLTGRVKNPTLKKTVLIILYVLIAVLYAFVLMRPMKF